jgi:hypothetical protein
MLLSATSNGVGMNVRLVGYGLSVSRYQGIFKGAPIGLLWWQQSGSLLVFADGSLKPFFVGRRLTNVGRGVRVASVVAEQPLGGA